MKYRFEEQDGKVILVVTDPQGVEHRYPIPMTQARNLNAQLTAIIKAVN